MTPRPPGFIQGYTYPKGLRLGP